MTITIKDLAQMANTSTATVSRVLSNKPGVAEHRRKRILELADRLGYSPNRLAQNLALQKSYVLGIIAADLRNTVYIDFFRRVQRAVETMGYRVLICDSELDVGREKHNIQIMRQHRAEGLLIWPVHDWHGESEIDHFLELKLQKFPFVVVGKIEGLGFDYVTTEEVEAARKLTERLLEQGHRRIGFVGIEAENRCIRERLQGVQQALSAAGLQLDKRDIFTHDEGFADKVIARVKEPDGPTALVMINGVCALMAYRPLLESGLRLPDDLSIVSFDDDLWASHLKPGLTTTRENSAEIARASIDMLMRRIESPEAPPQQRLIPQEIVVRDSIAPVPAR